IVPHSAPPPFRARCPLRAAHGLQPSYLNDNCNRVRYACTLPPSILTSSLVTSATRRSRSDFPAVSTALRAASSQELSLLPTTSITRYTPSGVGVLVAMVPPRSVDGIASLALPCPVTRRSRAAPRYA